MEFVRATAAEDSIIVRDYLAIWDSYGTPRDHRRDDAEAAVRLFLEEGRRDRSLASFIAYEDSTPAGSCSCQIHQMPYPSVIKPEHMLQGYIWSVYVDPVFRRRGVSTELIRLAVAHLKSLGCTGVVLHASEAGESLYGKLGFQSAREMRLKFAG